MTEKKNKWEKSPPELIDQFQSTVSELPGVEMRKMFGYPCSFINGNMFTGLHESNWVLRLSPDDREYMLNKLDAGVFEAMPGRVMREYVALPQKIITDKKELDVWLTKSLDFAAALPIKVKKK